MVRKKLNQKDLALVIGWIIMVVSILTFYLWHQTEIIRIGYETAGLEQKLGILSEEVKKLEAVKSSLLSLEKVDRIAREKLKLEEPGENQIIYEGREPARFSGVK